MMIKFYGSLSTSSKVVCLVCVHPSESPNPETPELQALDLRPLQPIDPKAENACGLLHVQRGMSL